LAKFVHYLGIKSVAKLQKCTGRMEEGSMLGAAEFTMFGNILMGIMAIAGVCSLLYAFGATLSSPASAVEQSRLDEEAPRETRKAA
jgi:hypothetical protein